MTASNVAHAEQATGLLSGFRNIVLDGQATFRALLRAMSFPGRVVEMPNLPPVPSAVDPAAVALLLTLVDADTPLWLDTNVDTESLRAHVRFHCGAPIVADASAARFALVGDPAALPSLSPFDIGTDTYPDRSATLILAVEDLEGGQPLSFTGPGIETTRTIAPKGLSATFADDWRANHAAYPCGVDLILTARDRLAALPRSARLED